MDCRHKIGFFVRISAPYNIVILKLTSPENMNIFLHYIYDNNFINEGTLLVEMSKKSSYCI